MGNAKRKSAAGQVIDECLGLRMRMANRVVTKLYDDALRPLGLRAPQLAMLALAEERGLLRQADICSELQLDNSTLSRNLDRMRSNGWLEETTGEDARQRPFQLTAEGRKLLRRAIPAWSKAQQQAAELLTPTGVDALRSFVRRQGFA